MSDTFWPRLVGIEHQVVTCSNCLNKSNNDTGSPQPSLVGAAYAPGGLVFVMQNPGSPPTNWDNVLREQRLNEGLKRFRSDASIGSYRALVTEMHDQMQGRGATGKPAWPSWKHPASKCVEGMFTPDQFAWVNLVKHRTPGSISTNRATVAAEERHGLEAHLLEELDLLCPRVVIAIGAPARRGISQAKGNWDLLAIGQRSTDVEARALRQQLASAFDSQE